MNELALKIGDQTIMGSGGVPTGGINMAWAIMRTLIQVLFLAGIIICFLFLVLNGIRWLMSEGDKQRVQKARDGLTFAVLGLVIIFLAFFIVNVISIFFNIDLLGTGILNSVGGSRLLRI